MPNFSNRPIVAPLLRKVLRAGRGRPIDRETRAFMEDRFGSDFGEVRLLTGAEAGAAADALRARAFTVGEQIVFQPGQYDPGTTAGRRLLAHELAHVVQQRGQGPGDPGAWQVGDEDDPLEREAERVADRVMSGGVPPTITPGPGGVLRRVVRPDVSSATITIRLGPSVQTPRAPSPMIDHDNDADFTCGTIDVTNALVEACISADASVQVNGAADDSLAGWTFGFIQVQWIETNWGYYRGQFNNHGSIFVQQGRPPARSTQVCRDTNRNIPVGNFFFDPAMSTAPFPRGPAAFPATINVNNWNDTPRTFYPLVQMNSKKSQPNFLREVQLEFHFLTVFSARDPHGAFTHLAHFFWNVHWQARFQPANFANLAQRWNVQVMTAGGGFGRNVGKVIKGAPTASPASRRETAMVAALTDRNLVDSCNDIADAAEDSIKGIPITLPFLPTFVLRSPNRHESEDWTSPNVTNP